jgi:NAD(P)-dependent dehydrogenase (short-subunit alcohol dehydrogenase family)
MAPHPRRATDVPEQKTGSAVSLPNIHPATEASLPEDPQTKYQQPPQPAQKQPMPGMTDEMRPRPDHGEESYKGSGKLKDRVALITGADSGIGRAVAIAFAREGADVVISYISEDEDAKETARWVEQAGRKAVIAPGDIQDESFCKSLVERTVKELGRIDCLINNAAHQASFEKIEDISAEEWEVTFRTNVHAMFYLCKAAIPEMKPGSTIINTTSINAKDPSPQLLAYATTKGAIANFTGGLAGFVADRGIRVNCVAPGPVWTPLIPSTMPEEKVESFGKSTPLGRAAQPAELAASYVFLASEDSSYITGAMIPVTGGRLML